MCAFSKSSTNVTSLVLIYLKLLTLRLQAQCQKVFLMAWLLFSAVPCGWGRIFVSSSKELERSHGKVFFQSLLTPRICLNTSINIYLKARALCTHHCQDLVEDLTSNMHRNQNLALGTPKIHFLGSFPLALPAPRCDTQSPWELLPFRNPGRAAG